MFMYPLPFDSIHMARLLFAMFHVKQYGGSVGRF